MRLLLSIILIITPTARAQFFAPIMGVSSVPGPFNYTIFSSTATCPASVVPTTACLGTSTFPSLPSGASYTVTNTNTDVTVDSSVFYNWPTFSVSGGDWPNNSVNSLSLATGTAGDSVKFVFPSATVQNTTSTCTPIYSTLAQGTSFTGRIDLWTMQNNGGSEFFNMQLSNAGSSLSVSTECGTGGSGGNCGTGANEVANGVLPTSSWYIWCEMITSGASGSAYDGIWQTPQNGGAMVANSLASQTGSNLTGLKNSAQLTQLGVNGGASAHKINFGDQIGCGITTGQTPCPFPVGPGLQLPTPSDSPGSGSYSGVQTTTASDISPVANIYYTTCLSAGCSPSTPTSTDTLYSGSFTTSPPQANSYISCYPNYSCSTVSTSNYASQNAAYISSGQCEAPSGTTSCTVGSLSIPSGSIIVVGGAISIGAGVLTVSDSNSDTPTYTTVYFDPSSFFSTWPAVMKAGSTVTSVTCSRTMQTGSTMNCIVAWYSPGTLSAALDKAAGLPQQGVQIWNSGNTAILSTPSDLLIDFWISPSNVTSTYSDGSTQRITCSSGLHCGFSDRTGWGTPGQAASGTLSGGASIVSNVIAIK